MPVELEFISPDDKPALLAVSDGGLQSAAHAVLQDLGYKIHTVANHSEFVTRFGQVQYQVVLIEDKFAADSLAENASLQSLQTMPMNQRRHAVVILIGDEFETLAPMRAFQHSVHAVVNRADIESLGQVILKVVSDNDLFLTIYRDAQLRIAQGN